MLGAYIRQVYNLSLYGKNNLILTVLIKAGHMEIYKYIYLNQWSFSQLISSYASASANG